MTILGLGPIWMSDNEDLKPRAAQLLKEGAIFAFGLSEQVYGADVYSTKVTELGTLEESEKIGVLKLDLSVFTGLPGGKGSLEIGDEYYSIVFYNTQALDGFNRWAPEIE